MQSKPTQGKALRAKGKPQGKPQEPPQGKQAHPKAIHNSQGDKGGLKRRLYRLSIIKHPHPTQGAIIITPTIANEKEAVKEGFIFAP